MLSFSATSEAQPFKNRLRGADRFQWGNAREIPFDFAQGRLSLRLKNGRARDDGDRM
jgi:hypothetical protein